MQRHARQRRSVQHLNQQQLAGVTGGGMPLGYPPDKEPPEPGVADFPDTRDP